MKYSAIPLLNGAIANEFPLATVNGHGIDFIPAPREIAVVTLPGIQEDHEYPYRYSLSDVNIPVYRIYCRHKNGADPSGDGSVEHPYTTIDQGMDHAGCVTGIAKCYWVQIIILGDSDDIKFDYNRYWGDEKYERVIVGSTDGVTYFSLSGDEQLEFSGILSQCNIQGGLQVRVCVSCKIKALTRSVYSTYAFNCECEGSKFGAKHMHSCICNNVYVEATSINNCKINFQKVAGGYVNSDISHIYDSEISINSESSSYFTLNTNVTVRSTFYGIKVYCATLIEDSVVDVKFPDTEIGFCNWRTCYNVPVILTADRGSAIRNTKISGKIRHLLLDDSAWATLGLCAVSIKGESERDCYIYGLETDLDVTWGLKEGNTGFWTIRVVKCDVEAQYTEDGRRCVVNCSEELTDISGGNVTPDEYCRK